MKHFELTEHTHPREIFLYQENLRANREWAKNTDSGKILEIKEQKVELPQWVKNKVKGTLGALMP